VSMPLPKSKSMSTVMRFLRKEHPEWSVAKRQAVALKHTGKSKPKRKK
jgi:hypothetical protein